LPIGSSAELVRVTRLDWRGCLGRGVTLYRFEGGGHQVPGRLEFLPRLLGPSSQQIRAAETALTFFGR